MGNAIYTTLALLADNGDGAAKAAPGSSFMFQLLTLWLPIILVFYWFLIRPQRQEQVRRRRMLEALKKNDRVITAGGVYGVVTNVHREANEVTIKVDESTNTKLRVTLGSIAQVLAGEPSEDTSLK